MSGTGKSFTPSRRSLLSGGAAALGGASLAQAASEPVQNPAAAPESDATARRQPFHGIHQSGIVTPRPATGMVAAFDVTATSLDELERLFRLLSERIAFLMQGGPAPTADPGFPPPDSGILGPVIAPDNLTVTVALGASLFDERFGLGPLKPKHLQRMKRFRNDALDGALCHGDLLLQFCANTADTNIHALRDILKNAPDLLLLRWKQEGTVPARQSKSTDARPGEPAESARNLLGFRDGTANPDAANKALMDHLVWVQSGPSEPDWAVNGSYQVVRIIRNFVERWDRTPLGERKRSWAARRRAARPSAANANMTSPSMPTIPRASAPGSTPISGSPIRAGRIRKRAACCAGRLTTPTASPAPGSSTWACSSSASSRTSSAASSPFRSGSMASR